jgi:hypothetical protein
VSLMCVYTIPDCKLQGFVDQGNSRACFKLPHRSEWCFLAAWYFFADTATPLQAGCKWSCKENTVTR